MTFSFSEQTILFSVWTSDAIYLSGISDCQPQEFSYASPPQHFSSITPAAISIADRIISIHSVGNIQATTIPRPRNTNINPVGLFPCRLYFMYIPPSQWMFTTSYEESLAMVKQKQKEITLDLFRCGFKTEGYFCSIFVSNIFLSTCFFLQISDASSFHLFSESSFLSFFNLFSSKWGWTSFRIYGS